jgi:uncharacterized linocin/CFP29 family protein
MSDTYQTNYPSWTDEQWGRVTKTVSEEAQKARVAAQFLPLYGPVDPATVAVPKLSLGLRKAPDYAPLLAGNRLEVDSSPGIYLTTLSVPVTLPNHEAADPEQLAALVKFRRAAVTIARLEDALIFNGQPNPDEAPAATRAGGWLENLAPVFTVTGGAASMGLVPDGAKPGKPPGKAVAPQIPQPITQDGRGIVRGVSGAIGSLEGEGHSGPFACFLSPDLYLEAHTPEEKSLVLPRDRIIPFLGGELLRRTNTIPPGYGIVVALGASPVEIVVASDISVQYLQQTTEPRFHFRVSEKVALRVKEWSAVAVLHPQK